MAKNNRIAEERTNGASPPSGAWTTTQAYTLAVVCLVLGIALGYLLRGSAPSTPAVAASSPTPASVPSGNMGPAQIPGMAGVPGAQMSPQAADQAAEPFLAALKRNPKDVDVLTKLGNLYYDAQLYQKAIEYYGQVLQITPNNADVRTDFGTSYWYLGNPDRAIAEFEKSLAARPNHPGTLFNMGVVKWQGKSDPKGAIAAWERLLQTNPGYAEKQRVLELIERAKQHAKG
jgi:cytochrome c-type biogenesis protein CcmH/NrfG